MQHRGGIIVHIHHILSIGDLDAVGQIIDAIFLHGFQDFLTSAHQYDLGAVDVVICDGFAGNVLLKSIEGTAMFMGSLMSKMFKRSLISKLAAALVMKDIKGIKKMMDYREIGGTQFLGIKKPVIKAHGSSDALAFRNAVKQAQDAAQRDFAGELEAVLAQFKAKENENA